MLYCALNGDDRMAMIDGYGVYHRNVDSAIHYFQKRLRIALKHTTRVKQKETGQVYRQANVHVCCTTPDVRATLYRLYMEGYQEPGTLLVTPWSHVIRLCAHLCTQLHSAAYHGKESLAAITVSES